MTPLPPITTYYNRLHRLLPKSYPKVVPKREKSGPKTRGIRYPWLLWSKKVEKVVQKDPYVSPNG